jgi:hypothetical protein
MIKSEAKKSRINVPFNDLMQLLTLLFIISKHDGAIIDLAYYILETRDRLSELN